MGTNAYPREATLSTLLHNWIDQDPENRDRLTKAGLRPGHVEQLLQGTFPEPLLMINAVMIERVTGFDLRELAFLAAKRELWGSDDALPDITTHRELMDAIREIAERNGLVVTRRQLGISDSRRLKYWYSGDGRPTLSKEKQILRVVAASRTGKSLVTETPSRSEKEVDVVTVLKRAHEQDPKRYRIRVIAEKMEVASRSVLRWFKDGRRPLEPMRAKIRRVFPELFGGVSESTPQIAMVTSEERPRFDDRDRRIMRNVTTQLSVAQDLLETIAERDGAILDGDRFAILKAVQALVKSARIDQAALRRLRGAGGATTPIDPHILDALGINQLSRQRRK